MFLTQPSAKQHPNLVNLLGFCNRRCLEAVVYDLNPLDTVHNLATTGNKVLLLSFYFFAIRLAPSKCLICTQSIVIGEVPFQLKSIGIKLNIILVGRLTVTIS